MVLKIKQKSASRLTHPSPSVRGTAANAVEGALVGIAVVALAETHRPKLVRGDKSPTQPILGWKNARPYA